MTYQIKFTRAASRRFHGLPRQVQDRIERQLSRLQQDPRAHGSLRLQATSLYRARVGSYRIIHRIDDDKLVVLIVCVGHRRDVYDRIDQL